MTTLHKAGLTGLWMTLEALEKAPGTKARIEEFGSWNLENRSVTLTWKKEDEFFKTLFKASFCLDRNGLFHFPALGDPLQRPQHAVVLQSAILGTILQHGKTRKSDSARDPKGTLDVEVNGSHALLRYCRVRSYQHQEVQFNIRRSQPLVGWLYPGGGSRHDAFKDTSLTNPPGLALALRYLPIGAIYFEIRQRRGGPRPRYAMVIPDIDDLGRYAAARRLFISYGISQLCAAGSVEAGMRVMAELEARRIAGSLKTMVCRVFSFGTVPWSSQQKTRVEIFDVQVSSPDTLRIFRHCEHVFPVRRVKQESGDSFLAVPQTPELVAQNLVAGRRWWEGFADFISGEVRRTVFRYEAGGLKKMVDDRRAFPEGRELVFVQACHEAWRRRMGQLGERARREGISYTDLIDREREKIRVALSRGKNAATVRETIVALWARAGGSIPSLKRGWKQVLELLGEKEWRKGRDLALLALASYQPAGGGEEEKTAGVNGRNSATGGER